MGTAPFDTAPEASGNAHIVCIVGCVVLPMVYHVELFDKLI